MTFIDGQRKKGSHTVAIILIFSTVAYFALWSLIGIMKMLSLHAYVFDLGINSERGWQILHTSMGLHNYIFTLINSGIVYLLAPLTGSGNFYAMIIFQSAAVAVSGPAIFLIAREKGLDVKVSLLLAIVFFIYFPAFGILWFDFHYQAFFVPFFIIGYFLYLKKNYVGSTFLLILSGLVRYPYSIFPLVFALTELFILYRSHSLWNERRRTYVLLLLIAMMFIWTVLGFFLIGSSSTIPHFDTSTFTSTYQSLWTRLYVIFLFLAPLMFLPIVRVRWFLLVLPAFFLFLASNYTWYTYPHVLQGQYVSGVVPFLMLGLVDFLTSFRKDFGLKGKSVWFSSVRTWAGKHLPIVTIIVILLTFMNLSFAPFGPLNQLSGDGFGFYQNTNYQPAYYSELSSMVKMIPASDSYVAYQNNIPEVLPRPMPMNGTILLGGYLGNFEAFSLLDALNNTWPVYSGGKITYLPIDYAIADANNSNFYLENNSMYSLVQTMYLSGKYGIVSEGYGLVLLERNYFGIISDYVPQYLAIDGPISMNYSSPSVSHLPSNNATITQDCLTLSGNLGFLFPGMYNLTFYLSSGSTSNISQFDAKILTTVENSPLGILTSMVTMHNVSGGLLEVTTSLNITNIYGNIALQIYVHNVNSDVFLQKIVLSQMRPYQHYSQNMNS